MGNRKKERAADFQRSAVNMIMNVEVSDIIAEHNFNNLVRRGIVRVLPEGQEAEA